MLYIPPDDHHPTVSTALLPMYNPELGCVAGYMRKMPSKSTPAYWARMNKWPQRWFWVSLDLHEQQNYQLCYTKQGANSSHTVQRVYHLVNGTLERTSETSFVLHIPNGEDLCLQCDSILETNRWLSTLSQLIHAANIRSESLSSAYIANLPSFDSIRTARSQSWANDSIASSFEDNVDAANDKKRKAELFVQGNHPKDRRTDIPQERGDSSKENSILVDYHSKSRSGLNYEALDEPEHVLQGNHQDSYSNDLSLASNDVPLVPNTHDRDFFNQLQEVLPHDDSTQKIDQDRVMGNPNLDTAQLQQTSMELLPLVQENNETLPSVLQKVDTVTQAVSTVINSSIQEAIDAAVNKNQEKAISRIAKCQDFQTDISKENVSASPHASPISEIDEIEHLKNEERQQQQQEQQTLPILNPSVIYGGHMNFGDEVDHNTKPDIPISDISFIVSEPSSSPSSNSTSTCFEGLQSDLQEANNIKTNILLEPIQGTTKKVIQDECIWVNEEEQDIACMSNSLVFEGQIRHTKNQSKIEFVSKNTSSAGNGHLGPKKSPDNETQQIKDNYYASVAAKIRDSLSKSQVDTLYKANEKTKSMDKLDSFADLASSECSTDSVYGSPPISSTRETLLDSETDPNHHSSTEPEGKPQRFCGDYELRDNEYLLVTNGTVNEIDDIVTKYFPMLLWAGSFAHYFKPITPIILLVSKIVHFTVFGLFTVARNMVWLLDMLIFQGWFLFQYQFIKLWEKFCIREKIVPTADKETCNRVRNHLDEVMTDLAKNISSKDADVSLQSSCL